MATKADPKPSSDVAPFDETTLRHEIEQRAYSRYCGRSCADGGDVEDWLAAEQEVLAEYCSRGAAESPGSGNKTHGSHPAGRRSPRR